MDTIGGRLKYLRGKMSAITGQRITKAYVSKFVLNEDKDYNLANYEANKAIPPLDKVRLLADFYSTTIDYIYYGNHSEGSDDLEDILSNKNINYKDKILSQYEKEFLLNTLKMLRKK